MSGTRWLRRLPRGRVALPAAGKPGGRGWEIVEIPVESIVFSRYQPREDGGIGVEELCESIRAYGVIQPVIVRRSGAGYELIAGERRVRACKMAGLETVPAIVRDYDDTASALAALIENVQREGLQPLEEAEAYRRLSAEFGLTQEQVAGAVGLSQSAVANKIRLLRLPEEVKEALRAGIITERHARALLRIEEPERQVEVLARIVQGGLTVAESEAVVEESSRRRGGRAGRNGRRMRVRLRIFKDVRLFINSFKAAVSALRRAGLDASLEERDEDEYIEVVMRIAKSRKAV